MVPPNDVLHGDNLPANAEVAEGLPFDQLFLQKRKESSNISILNLLFKWCVENL